MRSDSGRFEFTGDDVVALLSELDQRLIRRSIAASVSWLAEPRLLRLAREMNA
jgi:hypothetical protein